MTTKKIEDVAKLKEEEMELVYYEKYYSLFKETAMFLSHKPALLYGGLAINQLMPEDLKIYSIYSLPDIDVLSPHAERLASQLVAHLKKKHHEAVSFTEALHPNTYKVFVEGIQVADITQCDKDNYKTLQKGCIKTQDKIKIVPPDYLRMSLHRLMSLPNSAYRWVNVFERLFRFYKVFPVSKSPLSCLSVYQDDAFDPALIKQVYDTATPLGCVFFGSKEVSQILEKPLQDYEGLPPIQILVDSDITKIARTILDRVPGMTRSRVFPKDDFVLKHLFLRYEGRPLVGIYRLESDCVAYNVYRNRNVANINTILDMYLSMCFSQYPHFREIRPVLECLADNLSILQQKKSRKALHQQIVSQCYGPIIGMATMRRERVKRMEKKRRKH